jgi:phosphoglycolate phosphatase
MTGRTYDFWLLDLDGTLVDVETAYVHEVMGEVGDRLGRGFSADEAERLWYERETARDRVLDAHDVDREAFWSTFHEVEDPAARAAATYVYDDAASFVPALTEPVGLVTHCQSYLTEPILERLDIADWFDAVVCCSDDLGWKPDPAPVRQAMADLGVGAPGHRGVLAGDAPTDVGAARAAGLDAVHVARHGPDHHGDQPPGDRRIASLAEFET